MPEYKHPDFVKHVDAHIYPIENKRIWLSLTIDDNKSESIVVVLKNPSKATKDKSDKTVYTVTNYIYLNRENYDDLRNIGKIWILNLIPYYETDSKKLKSYKDMLFDKDNIDEIRCITKKVKRVIVAWGNHPKGLEKEYDELKNEVMKILATNEVEILCVDELSKLGNPKHGQVWGYGNRLGRYEDRLMRYNNGRTKDK